LPVVLVIGSIDTIEDTGDTEEDAVCNPDGG
jgi:hypothetical protein